MRNLTQTPTAQWYKMGVFPALTPLDEVSEDFDVFLQLDGFFAGNINAGVGLVPSSIDPSISANVVGGLALLGGGGGAGICNVIGPLRGLRGWSAKSLFAGSEPIIWVFATRRASAPRGER